MADMTHPLFASNGIEVVLPPALPIEKMIVGKPVDDAIEILPRVFNLCKASQSIAIRLACGRRVEQSEITALRDEIAREHELRLEVLLPAQLGLPPGKPARIGADMMLDEACENSPLLTAIRNRFEPFEACVSPDTPENTVAGRQEGAALMQETEQRFGRGPLWRVVARFCELSAMNLPKPRRSGGWVIVPAARGEYRIRAAVIEGRITAFERHTPTDDMLQAGGIFTQTLNGLRSARLAGLVIAVLDPCVPLQPRQVCDA